MDLGNRLIMAATQIAGGDDEGNPTDRLVAFYVARAKGGVGLIVTGAVATCSETATKGAGLNGYDDKFMPRLRYLARAIQAHGVKVVPQLVHGGPVLRSFRTAK